MFKVKRRYTTSIVHHLEFTMKTLMNKFVSNESGATAIEYGLIAALISVVCILAFGTIGSRLNTKFNNIGTALQ